MDKLTKKELRMLNKLFPDDVFYSKYEKLLKVLASKHIIRKGNKKK